ncbi:MAG: hypothetical protein KC609_23430 [Myxococcales bacterium]|nr:hypothetical protein [Myxococcales bacterium]
MLYLAYSDKGLLVAGATQYGWLEKPIVLLPSITRDGMRWSTSGFPGAARPETIELTLKNVGERPTGVGPREFWQLSVQTNGTPLVPGTTEQQLLNILLARGLGPAHRQRLSGVDGPPIERPLASTAQPLPTEAIPMQLPDFGPENSPIRFSLMQRPGEAPMLLVRAYLPCGSSTPQNPRCETSVCYTLGDDRTLSSVPESTVAPQIGNLLLTIDGSLCPRSASAPYYQGYSPAYSLPLSEGVYFYPASPVLGSTLNTYTLLGDDNDVPFVWLADGVSLRLYAWEKPLDTWEGALARLYSVQRALRIRRLAGRNVHKCVDVRRARRPETAAGNARDAQGSARGAVRPRTRHRHRVPGLALRWVHSPATPMSGALLISTQPIDRPTRG